MPLSTFPAASGENIFSMVNIYSPPPFFDIYIASPRASVYMKIMRVSFRFGNKGGDGGRRGML